MCDNPDCASQAARQEQAMAAYRDYIDNIVTQMTAPKWRALSHSDRVDRTIRSIENYMETGGDRASSLLMGALAVLLLDRAYPPIDLSGMI